MGKRGAVKKVVANTQEPSSSSSKKNRKRTMDKTDNGQKEKKSKKESKAKVQESSINDLPPEMLMKVLKNVDSKSLVGCRLVSKKWNWIASEILESRPDLELSFYYSIDNETLKFIKYTYQGGERRRRNLFDFMECFQNSKNFPFTHFCFREIGPSLFDQTDWIKFIYDLGGNIKGLKLSIDPDMYKVEYAIKVAEKVRNLLLNKLPELEKFGLDYGTGERKKSSAIQLFPTSENSGSKTTTVQLPRLKVLCLHELMFSCYTGIVTDLLRASVNLQRLEPFQDSRTFILDEFHLLQSLGKLECLQASDIQVDTHFLSKFKGKSLASLVLYLKKLNLTMHFSYKNEALRSDASAFISHLFESTKDTVRELKIELLGFLPDLQLPKFSKLISLTAEEGDDVPFAESLLPPGINLMETFPVLRSLVLGVTWSKAFPNEAYISAIPTVETLKVAGNGMKESFIPLISLLCPNLKDFEISRDDEEPMRNFPKVGRAIWTHLKKLESLVVYVRFVEGKIDDAFPAFDSCITGFSIEDCERLYDLLLAEQLLRNRGSQVKVPKSELEAERKFPSISDLKDLKSFELHVLCSIEELELDTDVSKMGATLVSKKCTLDLMENFTYYTNKKIEKNMLYNSD